jgi:hypothetical protein
VDVLQATYPRVHAASPMAKLNHLNIYGSMLNDEKHVQGILLLIAKRGGLEKIKVYGMAYTIQL